MEMQMSAATTMCVHFGYKGFGELCRALVLQLQASSDFNFSMLPVPWVLTVGLGGDKGLMERKNIQLTNFLRMIK